MSNYFKCSLYKGDATNIFFSSVVNTFLKLAF